MTKKPHLNRKNKIPNKETAKAMEETMRGEGLVHCESIDDMFNKLGIKFKKTK